MAIDTKKVELTQEQLENLMQLQHDIDTGKVSVVKENKQVIDGWTYSVGEVSQKIKDGKPVAGVSGGLVNIRGNGSNGLPLSNRPSLNIETVLHIGKNFKQILMFLLQDHQQYRQSGQKLDAHQYGDELVTVDKLVRAGLVTQAKVDEIQALISK